MLLTLGFFVSAFFGVLQIALKSFSVKRTFAQTSAGYHKHSEKR